MTINELLEAGIILQGLGKVYDLDRDGNETVYYKTEITPEVFYSPIDEEWADLEIGYMFPVPSGRGNPMPTLWIEIRKEA